MANATHFNCGEPALDHDVIIRDQFFDDLRRLQRRESPQPEEDYGRWMRQAFAKHKRAEISVEREQHSLRIHSLSENIRVVNGRQAPGNKVQIVPKTLEIPDASVRKILGGEKPHR